MESDWIIYNVQPDLTTSNDPCHMSVDASDVMYGTQ